MADDESKISEPEKQKILAWLNKRWAGTRACTVCGTNQWTLGEHLVAPLTTSNGNISIGGTTYPQVMVICNHCGHTLYFNAVRMGLSQTQPDPPPEDKSDG